MSNANMNAFPPALPRDQLLEVTDGYGVGHGLTKRELFAKDIAAGMCAAESEENGGWTDEGLAAAAVKRADALLAELAKGGVA